MKAYDLGLCPCGKQIYADTDLCSVMHDMPFCNAFEVLEPDEFLAYVRKARGIPDPQDNTRVQ